MCGIAGLTDPEDFPHLSRMLGIMKYRGPDDEGTYSDRANGVAIGMRRLSIVDLAAGHQPMSNEDDTLWVVSNGEIYNAPELRKGLESRGHRFKTSHSDTEVLLHLYEEKGVAMVTDLNGMYAFVLYDKKRRRFFGARDRMGIKPFYYARKNGRFAFASELKCLLELPWVSKEIDQESFYHYLSLQFVPAPRSIFLDIRKLPAGHSFTYDIRLDQLRVEPYWRLPFAPVSNRPLEEWRRLIRAEMEEAVERWTLSDVPIACSLSGGLDSAALVGFLAKSSGKQVKTYTLGFQGKDQENFSELPLARKVAEKWGTEHHELVVDPAGLVESLDKMVWHLDEPYGGGLPSWYVYEFIGRECKVAMTGTGGDELFGNYGKWRIHERPVFYRPLKKLKDIALHGHPWRESVDMVRWPHGHFYHRYLTDAAKDRLLAVKSRDNGNYSTERLLEDLWRNAGSQKPRDAVAWIDFQMQLPEEFLHVTDRFSMAHSVEARVPFLDHHLVELVFRVPAETRIGGRDPKGFLKSIIQDLLPEELLTQPKRGFILPLVLWTRRELRPFIEEALSPERLRSQGLLSERIYERLVRPHMAGERNFTEQIWTLVMFQRWYDFFLKGKVVAANGK